MGALLWVAICCLQVAFVSVAVRTHRDRLRLLRCSAAGLARRLGKLACGAVPRALRKDVTDSRNRFFATYLCINSIILALSFMVALPRLARYNGEEAAGLRFLTESENWVLLLVWGISIFGYGCPKKISGWVPDLIYFVLMVLNFACLTQWMLPVFPVKTWAWSFIYTFPCRLALAVLAPRLWAAIAWNMVIRLLVLLRILGQVSIDKAPPHVIVLSWETVAFIVLAVVLRWMLDRELRREIELKIAQNGLVANVSLLKTMCDAVVKVDRTACITEEAPDLARVLLHSQGRSLVGVSLVELGHSTEDGELIARQLCRSGAEDEQARAPQEPEEPEEPGWAAEVGCPPTASAFFTHLRDSHGVSMEVEIFHVKFVGAGQQAYHLVGIREYTDTQPILKLRPEATSSKRSMAERKAEKLSETPSQTSSSDEEYTEEYDVSNLGVEVQFALHDTRISHMSDGFQSFIGHLPEEARFSDLLLAPVAFKEWLQQQAQARVGGGGAGGEEAGDEDRRPQLTLKMSGAPRRSRRRRRIHLKANLVFSFGPTEVTAVALQVSMRGGITASGLGTRVAPEPTLQSIRLCDESRAAPRALKDSL